MSEPRFAVFDVCDTLYRVNTTWTYLLHVARELERRDMVSTLESLQRRGSAQWAMGAALSRLSGRDVSLSGALRSLRGLSRTQLEALARDFVETLRTKENAPLHDALQKHRSAGDQIILASGALDLIVAPLAETLNARFVASRLRFQGDTCTGILERNIAGAKQDALRAAFGPAQIVAVYTDNIGDKSLLRLAGQRFVVIPTGRSDRAWRGFDAHFIRL